MSSPRLSTKYQPSAPSSLRSSSPGIPLNTISRPSSPSLNPISAPQALTRTSRPASPLHRPPTPPATFSLLISPNSSLPTHPRPPATDILTPGSLLRPAQTVSIGDSATTPPPPLHTPQRPATPPAQPKISSGSIKPLPTRRAPSPEHTRKSCCRPCLAACGRFTARLFCSATGALTLTSLSLSAGTVAAAIITNSGILALPASILGLVGVGGIMELATHD